jgi:TolA-binding protein
MTAIACRPLWSLAMKQLITVLFALSATFAHAQSGGQGDSWSGFWEKLRMKVEQMTPQKKLATTTAVGGVRGSAVEASDVYWKGEAKPQSIDSDELTAFQKAMTLVEAEQKEQAQAAFTEFAKAYPNSLLKADADQAMARLLAGK